jgi:hypothetical protein
MVHANATNSAQETPLFSFTKASAGVTSIKRWLIIIIYCTLLRSAFFRAVERFWEVKSQKGTPISFGHRACVTVYLFIFIIEAQASKWIKRFKIEPVRSDG